MERQPEGPGVCVLPPEVLALVLAHVAGGALASTVQGTMSSSSTSTAKASGVNAWLKHLRTVCTEWRDEIDALVTSLGIKPSKKAPRGDLSASRFRRLSTLVLGDGMAAPEALLESVVSSTTLKSLTFHHNTKVYPHIGRLTTLTRLTVESVNQKTYCRQLETALRQLTALHSLSINGTIEEGNPCLRVALANMPALRSLEVVTTPFRHQLHAEGYWELCTGLTLLRISQYDVCIVRGLAQLQQLQHLHVELMHRGCEVKIEGMEKLPRLSHLEVIFPGAAEDAWLTDYHVSDFGKCTALTKLKVLGFSNEYWEHDELLLSLTSLRSLVSLSIGASAPDGRWERSGTMCPDRISNLTMLTSLHLEHYTSLPHALTKLTRLRRLAVQRMAFPQNHDWCIMTWAAMFSGLQHLDVNIPTTARLGASGTCFGYGIKTMDQLTRLQSLSIACYIAYPAYITAALPKLKGLTRLCLQLGQGSKGFHTGDLRHLPQLTRLKAMTLSSSYHRFTELPEGCFSALMQLEELSLAGCASFVQLPDSISALRALRSLNLDGCLSLKELPAWLSGLWTLEELTCNIDQSWILALKSVPWQVLMTLPRLRRLVLPAGLRKFGGVAAGIADEYALQHVIEWV